MPWHLLFFLCFCLLELQPWPHLVSLLGFLDFPLVEQMDVEAIIEETTRDAAAEVDRVAADEAAKAA